MSDAKARYVADVEACDTPDYRFEFSRRELGLLGTGLLLTVLRSGGAAPAARIHAGDDGAVTVFTGKIDMGQGVRASITKVVAEEMGIAAERVRVVMGDTELCPDDGGTWGSLTTPQTIPAIRAAARTARTAVSRDVQAPATTLGLSVVTGAKKFASDLRVDRMLHARVVRPPAYKAALNRVLSPSDGVIRSGNVLGVLAPNAEQAQRLAAQVRAEWQAEPLPVTDVFMASVREKSVPPKPGEGGRYPALVTRGDAEAALRTADRKYEATFTLPAIAHVPLEPRAA
ncbi:MAG TPA: molybdopterin cofactor-binding domain-containing protein, partial [Bryobacteraceae bacterium]|nr:molybdopterin cofactor-binding domain-containing protein [Bryobacteraceae bacterium]